MVLEIKSICCVESLRKIPEIFGLQKDSNWLNSVRYTLSVKTGCLVFAYRTKIIVLSLKWDSRLHQSKYSITWSDELPPYDDITAVLCLPITNEAEEIVAGILIGFNSGLCQLITTRGQVIISQQWYPEAVQSIQLPNEKKSIEEIYVMYKTCVCILQSKQLMQSLRNVEKLNRTNSLLGSVACRVWKYDDSYGRSEVVHSSVIGSKKIGLFDHLLAASMEGGFYASYKSSAPQQMAVLSVGMRPFAAFYYAKEIIVQPLVSVAIVQAVASQVKNALPSWFPGAAQKPQSVSEPAPQISTESMILRYGFYDDHRTGHRIWLSPYNRLAAVSDNLGRVILVDCQYNVVLRVWKGYRDAQCSFMKVDEKISRTSTQQKRRHALFIAIYSPKRSTVDIWNVERGRKLAVFPAGPNGQLIQQNSYSTVSSAASSSTSSVVLKPAYHSSTGAFFLNPTDLTIKELAIPFHYALDASNTKKSKDIHIINQIKADLKTIDQENMSELVDLCDSIQMNEMRFKCIGSLIKSRYLTPEIFSIILSTFLKSIEGTPETSDQEDESTPTTVENDSYSDARLSKFLHKYERLLLFYNGMKQKATHDDLNDSDEVRESEFEDILKVIEQYKGCLTFKKSKKVSILSPSSSNNNFIEYLSVFDASGDHIRLHESKSVRFTSVGFDLFDSFIKHHTTFDGFYKLATISTLKNKILLRLFLRYWMENDIAYDDKNEVIHHLVSFTHIVQTICDLDRGCAEHQYSALSPWWQNIREMLLQCSNVFKSLLAALLCRDLSVLYRQKEGQDSTGEDEVWEQVSQEIAQWSLLIGKLDDIAALSSILSFTPKVTSPAADVVVLDYTIPDISLMTIFSGGNGIVSELVAKWIASTGVKASALFTPVNEEELTEQYTPHSAVTYFDLLRKHFPFSLRPGALFVHLAWEYANAWNNNTEKFEYLKTSLEYLNLFEKPDFALKHGICCIIWNNILRKYIQTSMKLLNNIGRNSEESKSLSTFNDTMIPEFVTHCNKFIDMMSETMVSQLVELKFEVLLQDGTEPALTSQANKQRRANTQIVELHSQLLEVMLIISSLNVSVKGTMNSLFNEVSRELLACDISKELNESISRPDEAINKSRRHFLHRTINVAVDLIRKDFQDVYLTDFNLWIEKVMLLAKKWTLNQEELVKYQVVQLYTRGWDECAESKIKEVSQLSSIGKILLSITGTRLNNFVKDKPDLYSRVLTSGTRVSSYLEQLDESSLKLPAQSEEVDDLTYINRLQRLAKKTYECLAKQESSELKLAAQLHDACAEVKEYLNSIEAP
ncbi:rab3 GTPase-activating protein regulatory subunit [Contarinia nasturtii]|uniref:rab3 GTPase-activating protein regulatory subunit n=1 Tax=Contarinia nasturtii TaxID=265458 RepID=UPI0012D42ACA|nr:rab3 GTPase-activating protein regulatory subunit [Contarinia nasturtii]